MNVELATASANEIHRLKPAVAKNEMMLINLEAILNGTGNQTAFISNRKELESATRLLNKFHTLGLKLTNAPTNYSTEQAEARNKVMTKVYNAVRNGVGGKYDRQFIENLIIREGALNAIDRSTLAKMNDDLERAIGDSEMKSLETQFNAMSSPHRMKAENEHQLRHDQLNNTSIPNMSVIQELKRRLSACMVDIGDIALKMKPFYSEDERKTAFDNKVKECSHIPNQLLFETERENGDQGISNDAIMKLQQDLDDVIEKINDLLGKWSSTGLDTRRTTLYMFSKKAIDIIDDIEFKKGQRRYILNEAASESEMELIESLDKGKILLGDLYNVCVAQIGTVVASENIRQEELRIKAEAVVVHFFDYDFQSPSRSKDS